MRKIAAPLLLLFILSFGTALASLTEIQRVHSLNRNTAEVYLESPAPTGSVLEYSYDRIDWLSEGDVSGQASIAISGLEPDRVVFVRLKLNDSISNVASVRMQRSVAQNSFDQFNAVLPIQTDTDVGFRWVDRFDDETGWEIQRSTDGGTTWETRSTLPANATRFTEPTVNGNLHYRIRVLGSSHVSNWLEVTTQSFFSGMKKYHSFGYCKPSPETLFPIPAVLEADEAEKFLLSWTTDETTPSSFSIEVSWDGEHWINGGASSVESLDGEIRLAYQTTAPIWFRLVERVADTQPRVQVLYFEGTQPLTDLPPPDQVTVEAVPGVGYTVRWNDQSSSETGFWIEWNRISTHWDRVGIVGANQSEFLYETTITSGGFRVRAVRDDAWGFPSATAHIPALPPRILPSDLQMTETGSHQGRLTWTVPAVDNDGMTVIMRSIDGLPFDSYAILDSLNSGSWIDPESTPGRHVRYLLCADEAEDSNMAEGTVSGSPPAPRSARPMNTTGSASVTVLNSNLLEVDQADAFPAWKTLRITGSSSNDGITISQSGSEITLIHGTSTRTLTGPYNEIRILAEGGDDTILVQSSVTTVVTVVGGPGEDTLDVRATGKSTIIDIDGERDWLSGTNQTRYWVDEIDVDTVSDVDAGTDRRIHRVGTLYGGTTKAPKTFLANPRNYRATYSYPKNPFFGNGPSILDVNQGLLQNCPYTAYYQDIARLEPNRIEQYAVSLHDGTAVVAIAGGYVRIQEKYWSEWMATTGPRGNTWWLAMEKAWFSMSLPAPLRKYLHGELHTSPVSGKQEAMYEAIEDAIQKGHKLTTFTRLYPHAGWLPSGNHAHAVVDAYRAEDGTPMVVLRNPYGIQANFARLPRAEKLNFHDISMNTFIANVKTVQFYHFKDNSMPAPGSQDLSLSVSPNVPKEVPLICYDLLNTDLTYNIQQGPTQGTLSGTGSARIYTPNAEANGTDSFSWTVSYPDGTESQPDTVSLSIESSSGDLPPVIHLEGGDITLEYGVLYQEPGVSAVDSEDGDLTSAISTTGPGTHPLSIGVHTVNYEVTDSANQTTHSSRSVTVEDGDIDADGMSSAWELEHGLDPFSNTGSGNALFDIDNDGFSNIKEFISMTDPNDPSSHFQAKIMKVEGALHIEFDSFNVRQYTLQKSTSLEHPITWENVPNLESLPGTDSKALWPLPEANADSSFFRIRVSLPNQ